MLLETKHLRLATQYRMATLTLDAAVISHDVLRDLDRALGVVERTAGLDVLVVRHAACGLACEAVHSHTPVLGQRVIERLAGLDLLTVACIDGKCLDGALELALACDFRAASGGPETRLGFTGLRAGRIPCWGGTVRLPRLIGLKRAMDLLLSGRKLSAAQARAVGLIDRAFGPRLAEIHMAAYALELQANGDKPRRRRLLDFVPGYQATILGAAGRRIEREFSADQSAPRELLRAVTASVVGGAAAGLAAERNAHQSETPARAERASPLLALRAGDTPIQRIGIIGAGTIGAAVAQWAAFSGCTVAIHDRDPAAAWRRLVDQFREAVKRRLIGANDVAPKLESIVCTNSWDGFSDAELVIEAVGEDKDLKRRVLALAERRIGPKAFLATTTTAFPVRKLQKALRRPERLLGLHFGCPAAALKYVELAAGRAIDPEGVARVRHWLAALGRECVVVADRPGRVLGRVLLPYLHEAIVLASEGVPPAAIDRALRRWGMAWGPCATLDAMGLDVAGATLRELGEVFGPRFDPPDMLTQLVASGCLGRKSGVGFYRYGRSTPTARSFGRGRSVADEPTIVERTVARLTREAQLALEEKLVRDAATLNALLVGAGWPAFRGGPVRETANARAATRAA